MKKKNEIKTVKQWISDGFSVLLVIYTDWKKNQTIENVHQL